MDLGDQAEVEELADLPGGLHRLLGGHAALHLGGDRVLELTDLLVHRRDATLQVGGLAGVAAGQQRRDHGGPGAGHGELPPAGHGRHEAGPEPKDSDASGDVDSLLTHPNSIGRSTLRIKPPGS